jgi:hypothetical protein
MDKGKKKKGQNNEKKIPNKNTCTFGFHFFLNPLNREDAAPLEPVF